MNIQNAYAKWKPNGSTVPCIHDKPFYSWPAYTSLGSLLMWQSSWSRHSCPSMVPSLVTGGWLCVIVALWHTVNNEQTAHSSPTRSLGADMSEGFRNSGISTKLCVGGQHIKYPIMNKGTELLSGSSCKIQLSFKVNLWPDFGHSSIYIYLISYK